MRNEILSSPTTNPQLTKSGGSLRRNRGTLAGRRQNAFDITSPATNNLESLTQSLPPGFLYQSQNNTEPATPNTSVHRQTANVGVSLGGVANVGASLGGVANVGVSLGGVATRSLSPHSTEDEVFIEHPRQPSMASDRVEIHREAAAELNTTQESPTCISEDPATSFEMKPSLTHDPAAASVSLLGRPSRGSESVIIDREAAEVIQESSESRAEDLSTSIPQTTTPTATIYQSGQLSSRSDRVKFDKGAAKTVQESSETKAQVSIESQPHTVTPLDQTSPSIASSQIASPTPPPQHSPTPRPPTADEMVWVNFRPTSPSRTVQNWVVYTLADVNINEGEEEQIRYRRYCWHLFTISVFYALPAFQLILTYQQLLNVTGNQDICYYNYLCSHKLGSVRLGCMYVSIIPI